MSKAKKIKQIKITLENFNEMSKATPILTRYLVDNIN